MPTVTIPRESPLRARRCVMCGDEGMSISVKVGRIPPLAWLALLFLGLPGLLVPALLHRSRVVALPFDERCYRRWRLGQTLALLFFVAALSAPMGGLIAAQVTSDPSWNWKGVGTAVVLLGFPLFFTYSEAWRGPQCTAIRDEETVLWIPSEEAAQALSSAT